MEAQTESRRPQFPAGWAPPAQARQKASQISTSVVSASPKMLFWVTFCYNREDQQKTFTTFSSLMWEPRGRCLSVSGGSPRDSHSLSRVLQPLPSPACRVYRQNCPLAPFLPCQSLSLAQNSFQTPTGKGLCSRSCSRSDCKREGERGKKKGWLPLNTDP